MTPRCRAEIRTGAARRAGPRVVRWQGHDQGRLVGGGDDAFLGHGRVWAALQAGQPSPGAARRNKPSAVQQL